MATEITVPELVDAALAPSNVAVDGQSVTERPIPELLAAKKEIDRLTALAAANGNGGRVGGWGGAIKERYKYGGIE